MLVDNLPSLLMGIPFCAVKTACFVEQIFLEGL
jgi:hypothetical protein